jgi:hypothetical protein
MRLEVKKILKKDFVQRIIYGLGLVFWTIISIEELIDFPHAESSLHITYLTLYLIPTIILSVQIIRNNRILWGLIFGLFSAFILTSLFLGISDWITRSGNHVKAINWTLKNIGILIFIFAILGVTDWIIFKIRPKRVI